MLKGVVKIAPWITADENRLEWTLGEKRRAAADGARAALEYMRDHAPVKTGTLKASWELAGAKGVRINRSQFTISLQNDANELRHGNPHYYAKFIEEGFTHVPDMTWHPGHHDLEGAGEVAKRVIIESLAAHWTRPGLRKMSNGTVVYWGKR